MCLAEGASFRDDHPTWLVVGEKPLWKNDGVRQLGWLEIPNINGKIKLMATKPPTRKRHGNGHFRWFVDVCFRWTPRRTKIPWAVHERSWARFLRRVGEKSFLLPRLKNPIHIDSEFLLLVIPNQGITGSLGYMSQIDFLHSSLLLFKFHGRSYNLHRGKKNIYKLFRCEVQRTRVSTHIITEMIFLMGLHQDWLMTASKNMIMARQVRQVRQVRHQHLPTP